jgi:monoamine oxidase
MLTRRELIWHAARTGGYAAAFLAMRSMDLLANPLAVSTPFEIAPNVGRGTTVAILGAGIAGMVAAYEMRKAGFDCVLLEARQRPGGRKWAIRRGEKVEFIDGAVQQCSFDNGQYFNAGPARIPWIHKTMLGYCKELGVAMEVEVNTSRSAFLQSDKPLMANHSRSAKLSTTRVVKWPSYWLKQSAREHSTRKSLEKTASGCWPSCRVSEICGPTTYTPAPAVLD